MSNVALGGVVAGRPFAYYETLAGGAGGGPSGAGASGIHTHMTNTMNTPVEALEAYHPLRVRRYALRPRSGGRGSHPGGCGIVREIEFTAARGSDAPGRATRGRPVGTRGRIGGSVRTRRGGAEGAGAGATREGHVVGRVRGSGADRDARGRRIRPPPPTSSLRPGGSRRFGRLVLAELLELPLEPRQATDQLVELFLADDLQRADDDLGEPGQQLLDAPGQLGAARLVSASGRPRRGPAAASGSRRDPGARPGRSARAHPRGAARRTSLPRPGRASRTRGPRRG